MMVVLSSPPAMKIRGTLPTIPLLNFELKFFSTSNGGAAEPESQNPEPIRQAINIASIQDVRAAFEDLEEQVAFALGHIWGTVHAWGDQMTDGVRRPEGRIVRLEKNILRVRRSDSSDSGSDSDQIR
jgi:hypothetical protein